MKTPIKTLLTAAMLSSTIASAPAQAVPAAPLTKMRIYAVGSSNCGWEYPKGGQFTTTCDHGGAVLQVAVLEVGYGFTPQASMMGDNLPSSALIETIPVCMYGDLPGDCHGQSIEAFIRVFQLNAYQNGQFVYQNRSVNAPGNTMSTWIIVR